MKNILRWTALPICSLFVNILCSFLANRLVRAEYGDFRTLDNATLNNIIAFIAQGAGNLVGVLAAMICAYYIAPKHKVGAAKTIAVLHCIIVLVSQSIVWIADKADYLGIACLVGNILGVIIGWLLVKTENFK